MKPYFKILIVAENAADLKQKSLEHDDRAWIKRARYLRKKREREDSE